jgi:hypothetical protein
VRSEAEDLSDAADRLRVLIGEECARAEEEE